VLCVIPHPFHTISPASGYDLAIVIIKYFDKHVYGWETTAFKEAFPCKTNSGKYPGYHLIDDFRSWATPDQLPKGVKLEIAGYPGSKDCEQWFAQGPVATVSPGNVGNYIVEYFCDSEPGQSGSSVMVIDEQWQNKRLHKELKEQDDLRQKDCKKAPMIKRCIGVHTGCNSKDQCNYGTLITPEIEAWIKRALKFYAKNKDSAKWRQEAIDSGYKALPDSRYLKDEDFD